jgi:hypothetical protein
MIGIKNATKRRIVVSSHRVTSHRLHAGGVKSVLWFEGWKTATAYDLDTGELVTVKSFVVNGSMTLLIDDSLPLAAEDDSQSEAALAG